MKKTTIPSHIIISVEKTVPREDVCAFCTNVSEECGEIRFTYNSYDNQSVNEIYNLLKNNIAFKEELFVITDSQEVINYTNNIGIAVCGLYTPGNKKEGLSGVLYCIEDLEFIDFTRIVRMWQRHMKIPWTIKCTDRLIIREQTPEDLDDLYEIYSDPEIGKYTENLYEDRNEEYNYLVDYAEHQYKFYEYGIWALEMKDTGELIGRAGLSLRPGCDDLELGFVIGSKYRHCGYAFEACSAIIEYAREEFGCERFTAYAHRNNRPSVKLLKKLGFTRCISDVFSDGMCLFLLTKQ